MVYYYDETKKEHILLLDYTAGDGCPDDLGYEFRTTTALVYDLYFFLSIVCKYSHACLSCSSQRFKRIFVLMIFRSFLIQASLRFSGFSLRGLQLEFRHPKFHPNWITDENGNLDEARIRTYWENELAGYITWDCLLYTSRCV